MSSPTETPTPEALSQEDLNLADAVWDTRDRWAQGDIRGWSRPVLARVLKNMTAPLRAELEEWRGVDRQWKVVLLRETALRAERDRLRGALKDAMEWIVVLYEHAAESDKPTIDCDLQDYRRALAGEGE